VSTQRTATKRPRALRAVPPPSQPAVTLADIAFILDGHPVTGQEIAEAVRFLRAAGRCDDIDSLNMKLRGLARLLVSYFKGSQHSIANDDVYIGHFVSECLTAAAATLEVGDARRGAEEILVTIAAAASAEVAS
jgi:hypothetical protein